MGPMMLRIRLLMLGMILLGASPGLRAAPLVQQLVGFETAGVLDECATQTNAPCIGYDGHATCDTGIDPWSPDETYVLQVGETDGCTLPVVAENGAFIHSFVSRFDNVTAIWGDTYTFARAGDSVGACWTMSITDGATHGSLRLRDANGDTLFLGSGDLAGNLWTRWTLYWQKDNSADWELWASDPDDLGETTQRASGSGADLDAGGTADTALLLSGAGSVGGTPANLYVDNLYVITDAAGIADAVGWYTVVGPFQTEHASAVADNGTDTLLAGLWEDMAATPQNAAAGTYAFGDEGYRRTNGSSRDGPNGDARLSTGHIRAAKWIASGHRYPKFMWYGKATQDPTYTVVEDSQSFTNGRVRVTYDVDDPTGGARVPSKEEYFVLGFSNESLNPSEYSRCRELWSFVLRTQPTVTVLDYDRMLRGYARGVLRGGW